MRMWERTTLLLAAAFSIALALPAAAQMPEADPRLAKALGDHASFATGFRQKFATGYYSSPGLASAAKGAALLPKLVVRLSELSTNMTPTYMLVHWTSADGKLHAWLLGREGVIAGDASDLPYRGLSFLLDDLGVNARTATRAPQKRGAPLAVAIADPSTPQSRSVALEKASGWLLPATVGRALAARNGRLLILPAQDTGTAPYAALLLGSAVPLNDNFSIVVLPDVETALSSERMLNTRRLRFGSTVLVANPDLSADPVYRWGPIPATWTETKDVAEIFGIDESKILTGSRASHYAVINAIDGYQETDIVYLASHGVANSVNPMDGSFIALSGKHLYGRDLLGPRFEAWAAHHPLVVLSACQTALGKTFQGGTFGVARGWYAAGASQVVASLWNVDDRATAFLMKEFAEKLYFGSTPEQALQMAQRKAAAEYPGDPGAWASFNVYGAPAISR